MTRDSHPRTQGAVVNPRVIGNNASARLQRAETDPINAQRILDMIQRMDFVLWKPPLDEVQQLQAITRRMNQLKVEVTRQSHRLHTED